jgi:hypothetical protein
MLRSSMHFVITSGTGIREIVDQRKDARSAHKRVMDLVSMRRPNVRIFDQDGHPVEKDRSWPERLGI